MTDDEKIRDFEREILDKVYLEKEFYQYSDDIVIPHLLQSIGDIERHTDQLEITNNFLLTNIIHGVSHCIKWSKTQKHPLYDSISIGRESQKIIVDFLQWGTAYHTIAQEFVTWSRGIKTPILNEQEKKITFINPIIYDYSNVFSQQTLYREYLQEQYEKYPHEEIQMEFSLWFKYVDLSNPPIINNIDWKRAKKSSAYPKLLATISELIFPEVQVSADLGGYTLKDLRQFYTLIYFNFYFICWVEKIIDAERGVNHSFGSNPLYLTLSQFVRLCVSITDLSPDVVSNIIKDLTFDHTNFHSSISIQPFVLSNSGMYYVLPNLFQLIDPSRMIAGAFNKGSKKKLYDRLINQIENSSLINLSELIVKKTDWICICQKNFRAGKLQVQPDLIIIDINDRTVMVIDYKHYIGPISASEVDYKLKEFTKAVNQVNSYVNFLSRLTKIGNIDVSQFKIEGMILTYKPLPIPIPLESNLLISDSITFKKNLDKPNFSSNLGAFAKSFNVVSNLDNEKQIFGVEQEIKVKDWTIVRQLMKTK